VQRIVMSDLPHPTDPTDPDSWFGPGTTDPSRGITLARFTTGNKVTPLIDGEETFRQMVAELRKVGVTGTGAGPVARGDFIRLAGWWLTDSFPLVGKDPTSTFHSLASAARAAGVPVNALLWDQAFSSQNDAEVANINAMGGRAVLDADHIIAGAHHQKMLIVNGAGGALAFCGGIDINPDRSVGNAHEIPDKFHDVHAKVEGPAVADINFTFLQRWNNHPTSATGAALPVTSPPYASRPGSHFVHVSRTFPPRYRYPFLPVGEDLGTLRAVLRAIGRAQRFIYLEDQYAMPYAGLLPNSANADGLGIRDALRAALSRPGFEYLIIVTALDADLWQAPFRRHTFITGLKNEFPGRVHAFYLRKPGAHNIYVHSKAWIIDDVYVKIGSANCTRRGFTNETELDIHVIDEALESGTRRMARDFRLRLWAEHLGVGARPAVLADPTHALSYWLRPEKGSHIAPYDDTDVGTLSDQSQWDTVLDPDGR
jgi:phosphatidylserine/phosphatidylglycerophosphate/cardiolipin synthase-like enzyme